MSELDTSAAGDQPPELQTAGALLKQARESAGLHIAALAVSLKVPVKKLEALESNRFDLLPDAVFIRALASSVCRTLKIDSAPVLAQLPQTDVPKLTYRGVGINAPFRSPGDGPHPSIWTQMSRPATLAGLALLLGALVLVFLPAIKTGVKEVKSEIMDSQANATLNAASVSTANPANLEVEKPSVAASQPRPSEAVSASTSSGQPGTVAQSRVSETGLITANAPPNLNTPLNATASNPAPTSSSKTLTAGVSAGTSSPTFVATPKPPLDTDVIVFTAKGQSWVEVTDARGQVVLRRVLNAGEVTGAAGVLPLRVTIGRANETQVQIRGKAFDLNAAAKDNVARFEVK